MYLILKRRDRYWNNNMTEEIIGYKETLEEAEEYIETENPKLEFDKRLGNVCYIYRKVEKL